MSRGRRRPRVEVIEEDASVGPFFFVRPFAGGSAGVFEDFPLRFRRHGSPGPTESVGSDAVKELLAAGDDAAADFLQFGQMASTRVSRKLACCDGGHVSANLADAATSAVELLPRSGDALLLAYWMDELDGTSCDVHSLGLVQSDLKPRIHNVRERIKSPANSTGRRQRYLAAALARLILRRLKPGRQLPATL